METTYLTDEFREALKAIYLEEDKHLHGFEAELPKIDELFSLIHTSLQEAFDLVRPLGRGGAGLVSLIRDRRLGIDRALKFPRPTQDDELIDSVRNEADHLKKLRHENLIQLHALGEVQLDFTKTPYPYIVMDFIPNVRNIKTRLQDLLDTAKRTQDLPSTTQWLASRLFSVARAVEFLHRYETIHFDIKPTNILVAADDKAVVTDLGFAKKKSDDADTTIAGFTLFYAHPDLRAKYHHMSSLNRVRKPIAPADFHYTWDIYALGKTTLELLSMIDQRFPDAVQYDYTFLYLHLLACRMLDGRNASKEETERIWLEQDKAQLPRTSYRETWFNLRPDDFLEIRVETMRQVVEALAKLSDEGQFMWAVPELNDSSVSRIQISAGPPAPFSTRVKAVVEHPVFARLSAVQQLGLASTIYPGVTHTRLEHSIGTFRTCWLYVRSLYQDSFNPFFKQLATDVDLRAVMLASLLHDLGQYPLAHEIEDSLRQIAPLDADLWTPQIKHESLTLKWLDNPTTDKEGRTLKALIENTESGWGVPMPLLKGILGSVSGFGLLRLRNLKVDMLRALIDGPVDVDKLDYLVRDSEHAYLPYGSLIDLERLVRSLTIVITHDDEHRASATLGTYEKGQSAAESVTFARYLLYQALYWHHTARAIRAMLREAIRPCVQRPDKGSRKPTFCDSLEKTLGVSSEPSRVDVDDILTLIGRHTDEKGRGLIELLKLRRYYKRVLTIHSHWEEEGKAPLLQRFRSAQSRPRFDERLQVRIRQRLENYRASVGGPKATVVSIERTDSVLEALSAPGKIISDAPVPNVGSKEKLRFMPQPKRLLQNYGSRVDVGERVSEVWQQVYYKLMDIASKGRIFCDPDIRDTLMVALGPDGIKQELEELIQEFGL